MTGQIVPMSKAFPKGARRARLWHAPASWADRENALAGRPWVTLCGLRRGAVDPARAARRGDGVPPAAESCVVCLDLRAGLRGGAA